MSSSRPSVAGNETPALPTLRQRGSVSVPVRGHCRRMRRGRYGNPLRPKLRLTLHQGRYSPRPAAGSGQKKVICGPLGVSVHPSKITNRRIYQARAIRPRRFWQAALAEAHFCSGVVDKFEPPSEVSNFDQTATKKRIILHVRPAGAAAPSPPTPPPPG
jgi:hypothetical protein